MEFMLENVKCEVKKFRALIYAKHGIKIVK